MVEVGADAPAVPVFPVYIPRLSRASCRCPGGPWERSVAHNTYVAECVRDALGVVFHVDGRAVLEADAAALGRAAGSSEAGDIEEVDHLAAAVVVECDGDECGGHASSPKASSSGFVTTRSRWPTRSTGH